MKHASTDTIKRLSPLLRQIRKIPGLVEKKPGIYYRRSKAFLHFHEEGDEVFADVRLVAPDFDRFPCTTSSEQTALVTAIASVLAPGQDAL